MSRIGGADAVDFFDDLTALGFELRRHRDRRRIRAAAAEGRDFFGLRIHALKSGEHDHAAAIQFFLHANRPNVD